MPDKVVTNVDLEGTLDTSDEWIVERTGHPRAPRRRHHHRARHRGVRARHGARRRHRRRHRPRAAVHLHPRRGHARLGQRRPAGARASPAAPSTSTRPAPGSSTGSSPPTASSAPGMQRVLLVGSETMSRIVDWEDRSTAILFGDGAGAVVLERGDGPGPDPRAGTSAPTARCATSSTPTSAARSRWTAPRCSAGPCGSWSTPPSAPSSAPGVSVERRRPLRPAPGQLADHRLGPRQARHPRGAHRRHPRHHRQHLGRLDPDGPGRRRRRRPAAPRRPRAPHRLRRRHVLGLRRDRMGGMSERPLRRPARSWSPAAARASASAAPAPSRPPGTGSPSPRRRRRSTRPGCSP